MKNIGIIYGSTSGGTESVAKEIAKKLNVLASNVIDVSKNPVEQLNSFDILFLGTSTMGFGDLQYDWEDFIGKLKTANLSGKKVAVFGTGDSASYTDSFCNALSIVATTARSAGATIIGNKVDPSDYDFSDSEAVVDGYFCGLAIDEDNESSKTAERIEKWLTQLKPELQ